MKKGALLLLFFQQHKFTDFEAELGWKEFRVRKQTTESKRERRNFINHLTGLSVAEWAIFQNYYDALITAWKVFPPTKQRRTVAHSDNFSLRPKKQAFQDRTASSAASYGATFASPEIISLHT